MTSSTDAATDPTTATTSSSSSSSSDEIMRKLLKPNATSEQVLQVLQKSYAKEGETIVIKKELESYDDQNYWVTIGNVDFLVKIHNGVESKDLIKCCCSNSQEKDGSGGDANVTKSAIYLQNTIMTHLSQHGVSTSQPQTPYNIGDIEDLNIATATWLGTPGSIHKLPVVSAEHCPCPLVVRVMSWVSGRTMNSVPILPLETLADAGRFLGNMQKAFSTMGDAVPLAAKRYHQWDGKNTKDLVSFVQYIKDEKKRSMVESVIATFTKEIIDSQDAESLPTALIHADFNDANILVNDNLLLSGVLDYGDSVESWRVLDLSVAMAYAMMTVYGKKQRAISAAAAFLRGFNAVMPLTAIERKHLILLIACRLSCSATLGAYSYQQTPENEYLLLHSVPAWNTLELLWCGSDELKRQEVHATINKVFDLACSIGKEDISDDDLVIDCSDLSFPDPSVVDPLRELRVTTTTTLVSDETNERPAKRRKSH